MQYDSLDAAKCLFSCFFFFLFNHIYTLIENSDLCEETRTVGMRLYVPAGCLVLLYKTNLHMLKEI